jgi:hypothetical protein
MPKLVALTEAISMEWIQHILLACYSLGSIVSLLHVDRDLQVVSCMPEGKVKINMSDAKIKIPS